MAHHISETASWPSVCRKFVLLFPYHLRLRVKTPCSISSTRCMAICSFLFIFMLLVRGGQTSGAVAGSSGVKNPQSK